MFSAGYWFSNCLHSGDARSIQRAYKANSDVGVIIEVTDHPQLRLYVDARLRRCDEHFGTPSSLISVVLDWDWR